MRILSELNCDRARAFSCARSAVSTSAGWLGLALIFRLDLLQQTDQLVQERPETRLLKARKCLRQVETLFCTNGLTSWSGKDQWPSHW